MDFTNKVNEPGLYRQKETGHEIVLEQTAGLGSPIIDAFIKVGYERVSDAPEVTPEVETADVYTESVTKSGATQYRLNGKLISKEQYESKQ